jgi:hypothetical protein
VHVPPTSSPSDFDGKNNDQKGSQRRRRCLEGNGDVMCGFVPFALMAEVKLLREGGDFDHTKLWNSRDVWDDFDQTGCSA